MADSTTNLDTVSQSVSQREVQINELFDAASPATLFGRHGSACAGLVFGYYGGRAAGTSVANGTVTATASNTNYVVAHRTTFAVTISTSNTNWNNTTTYGRMFKLTAGTTSITAREDYRALEGGILSGGSSAILVGDSGSGGTAGLAPAPAAGDAAAGKYLSAGGTWSAPGGAGGWPLLESHSASSSANIDFTAWYSSTYDVYILEITGLIPQNNATHLSAQLSTDGGSTWISLGYYSWSMLESSNAGTGTAGSDGLTGWVFMHNISNNSNYEHDGTYRLYRPAGARYKSVHGSAVVLTASHPETQILSAHWTNTTAYNAIRFFMSSGNIVAGNFRMYGVPK